MKRLSKALAAVLSMALLAFAAPDTAKAAYPDRPITIIVPFGPGGAVDITARILAEWFQGQGITLNVVCKGGGGGAPAMLDVAKARPDGYTFGFPAVPTFSSTPQIKKTGYTKDNFRAVAQITNMWLSMCVRADSGIESFTDYLEKAKDPANNMNFASHGAYSTQRIYMSTILQQFPELNLPHIAYTSGHDVATALLGGKIMAAWGVTTNHKPYVASGDFKMLGVSSGERLEDFPDVPTFQEQLGGDEKFVFPSSHGLIAPKKTPDDKVNIMSDLIRQALADPGVQEKFKKAGLTCDYLPATEFQTVIDETWDFIGKALQENEF